MAIKVNNITVIDNDRTIKNVPSITYSDGSVQTSKYSVNLPVINTAGTLLNTISDPNTYSTPGGDLFGWEVAISGKYAIISAYGEHESGGNTSGVVYIFDIDTGILLNTIKNPNAYSTPNYDHFGWRVAAFGDYFAASAIYEGDSGSSYNSGAVYVFRIKTGELLYTLGNPNAYGTRSADEFGSSIAMSANHIIVGAWGEKDTAGAEVGAAYIFSVFTGELLFTLRNPDSQIGRYTNFGTKVAINNKYAAVTAPYVNSFDGYINSGKLYIFELKTGDLIWSIYNPNAYDTSYNDRFGFYGLAMNDDFVAVNAFLEDDPTQFNAGKVYVFNLNTGRLALTLDNPNAYNGVAGDQFGYSISMTEKYMAVGTIEEGDVNNVDSGVTYIFNINTGALIFTFTNPDVYKSAGGDNFGNSVAVSNGYVLIGAPFENTSSGGFSGNDTGKAYIFAFQDLTNMSYLKDLKFEFDRGLDINHKIFNEVKILPSQVNFSSLTKILDNPNAYSTSANDNFGYSIAISDYFLIVSARDEDDSTGTSSGKAYIYNVANGELLSTLNNPNVYDTGLNDNFGYSVAISNKYAVVSAPYEDESTGIDSGKVYVYHVANGALTMTLSNPNAYSTSANDFFGISVSVSDDNIAVSATGEDDATGTSSGKVYIYYAANGALRTTLSNPSGYSTTSGDLFGRSISLSSDNKIIIGAPNEDDAGGTESGKVYVYNIANSALMMTINNPNAYSTGANDQFGDTLFASNKYILVGVDTEDDSSGLTSGKAYIFDTTTGTLNITLKNPFSSASDQFGFNIVDLSDNYAIVGSLGEDTPTDSGKAYIFDLKTGKIISVLSNPNAYSTGNSDNFGYSVAISNQYAAVSAYGEDDINGTSSGKVYIYKINEYNYKGTYFDKLVDFAKKL